MDINEYKKTYSHGEIDVLGYEHKIVSKEYIQDLIKSRDGLVIQDCTTLYNEHRQHPKELPYKSFFKFWKQEDNIQIPIGKVIVLEDYGNIVEDLSNKIVYYSSVELFDYFIGFQFYDVYNPTIEGLFSDNKKGKAFLYLVGLYYGEQGCDVNFEGFNRNEENLSSPLDLIVSNRNEQIFIGCYYQKKELTYQQITSLYGSLVDELNKGLEKKRNIAVRSKSGFSDETKKFARDKNIYLYGSETVSQIEKMFNLKKIKKTIDQQYIDFENPKPLVHKFPYRKDGRLYNSYGIDISNSMRYDFGLTGHSSINKQGVSIIHYLGIEDMEIELYDEEDGFIRSTTQTQYVYNCILKFSNGTQYNIDKRESNGKFDINMCNEWMNEEGQMFVDYRIENNEDDLPLGIRFNQNSYFQDGLAVISYFPIGYNILTKEGEILLEKNFSFIKRVNNYFIAYNSYSHSFRPSTDNSDQENTIKILQDKNVRIFIISLTGEVKEVQR